MIRPLTFLFGSVMDSIGKPQMNFYINLSLLITSFLIHTFFILQFGGIGAAYALPVQYAITMIVMYVTLRNTIGFRIGAVLASFRKTYHKLRKLAKSKS